MCLAVPGELLTIVEGEVPTGEVSFAGVTKTVCLALLPEAKVGDYVVVHAGFAISRVDAEEARKVFDELRRAGVEGA